MYEFDPTIESLQVDVHAVAAPRSAMVANIWPVVVGGALLADQYFNDGKATRKAGEGWQKGTDALFGNPTQNEFRDLSPDQFGAPGLLGQANQSYGREAPYAYEADPFMQGGGGYQGGAPSLSQMYAQGGAGSGNGMFYGQAPGNAGIYSQGLQSPISNNRNTGNPYAGAQDSWQHRQLNLANMLQDRAMGRNSVADMQHAASMGRLTAQQQALAASNRRNPGLAMYAAQANAGAGASSLAQQAAIARMQEAQMAQQQLGSLTTQARDQSQRLTLANQQAQLDQGRMNDSRNLSLQQLYAQQQQAYQDARTQRFNTLSGVKTSQEKAVDSAIEVGKAVATGGGGAGGKPA